MSRRGDANQRDGKPKAGAGVGLGVVLGLIGFIAGATIDDSFWGGLTGALLGVLLNAWRSAKLRATALAGSLSGLETRLRAIENATRAAQSAADTRPETSADLQTEPDAAPVKVHETVTETSPDRAAAIASPLPPRIARPARTAPRPPEPGPLGRGFAALRDLAFGGNTVVRVGVLVLLVGVLLLAKWAVDNSLFPVEARLASAAGIGLALVVLGYRLREQRPGFATTLQGGGVAALYLVIFTAYRVFELAPAGLAFTLFVVVSAAGGLLAVAQRSQPLIFIGSLGGFLAPILASSGSGNHVVLFSYYLLLIAVIAAVAWRQSWRALNVLAFVSTYGVATAWGVLRYRADDFGTTEPFLLAYMLLFTGIAVLYAWRQPPQLRGLVDGTLVFGTPLVTLVAQARLVHEMELGLALSAGGFGLFYAVLAGWLWRAAPSGMRPMCEAFIALAVGFGTMAIPFALDDAMTTALAWSLEGAGLYWVGVRQNRRLPRYTAILLQGLATVAFAFAADGWGARVRNGEVWPLVNAHFLSALALAFVGLFMAQQCYAGRSRIGEREARYSQWLIGWGLLWWYIACVTEIDRFVGRAYEPAVAIGGLALSALVLERVASRLDWKPGRIASLVAIPVGMLAIPATLDAQGDLIRHGAVLAWAGLVGVLYHILSRLEDGAVEWARRGYAPALWLTAAVLSVGALGLAERSAKLGGDWPIAAFGLGLGATLLGTHKLVREGLGGFGRHASIQLGLGLAPVVGVAALWSIGANLGARGDAHPLPYLPILNPTDLALCMVALGGLVWWRRASADPEIDFLDRMGRAIAPATALLGFVWLNGLLARTVHQWTGVRFDPEDLWESAAMQVTLSIAWTLVALAGMWLATRRSWRPVWMAAATLLGIVVTKLFLVDLSQLGTGAKIVTFLVVGALLLVVGWLSPVPPSDGDDEAVGEGLGEAPTPPPTSALEERGR